MKIQLILCKGKKPDATKDTAATAVATSVGVESNHCPVVKTSIFVSTFLEMGDFEFHTLVMAKPKPHLKGLFIGPRYTVYLGSNLWVWMFVKGMFNVIGGHICNQYKWL